LVPTKRTKELAFAITFLVRRIGALQRQLYIAPQMAYTRCQVFAHGPDERKVAVLESDGIGTLSGSTLLFEVLLLTLASKYRLQHVWL
jgi:hypothetical protein